MPPTVRQLVHETTARFNQAHIDSPAITARAIVSRALNHPREWLTAHDDEMPNQATVAQLQQLVERVLAHEPLAYILGRREFYGLDFEVDSRVLIPRPETEMLVDAALAHLRIGLVPTLETSDVLDVIDVGTGSGAIAVAIAVHASDARIAATDVSASALEVARENARRNQVMDRIRFVNADLLDGVDLMARVITANLPYVTEEEISALPAEIQSHEPRVALSGGTDGLELVRKLLQQLDAHLIPGGLAVFEIGAAQGQAALQSASRILPGWQVDLRKDLAKLDRMLYVVKPNVF